MEIGKSFINAGRWIRPHAPRFDFGHSKRHAELNNGWYGATSSMTGVLGRMASYSGVVVNWDDAVAKGPSEMPEKFALDATPPVLPDAEGNYPVPVPGVYKPF